MSSHSTRQPPNKGKINNRACRKRRCPAAAGEVDTSYLPPELVWVALEMQSAAAGRASAGNNRTKRFRVVY